MTYLPQREDWVRTVDLALRLRFFAQVERGVRQLKEV
jgi:hypothetical protein